MRIQIVKFTGKNLQLKWIIIVDCFNDWLCRDDLWWSSAYRHIYICDTPWQLFLRHDDRAKNNVLIEGEAEPTVENNEDTDDPDNDPKWRLVADKSLMRKNSKSNKPHKSNVYSMEFSESEDDASSDEGADVEFLINSKEEEEELQRKLSAAGQHMQDSVVSAYTGKYWRLCVSRLSGSLTGDIHSHI